MHSLENWCKYTQPQNTTTITAVEFVVVFNRLEEAVGGSLEVADVLQQIYVLYLSAIKRVEYKYLIYSHSFHVHYPSCPCRRAIHSAASHFIIHPPTHTPRRRQLCVAIRRRESLIPFIICINLYY